MLRQDRLLYDRAMSQTHPIMTRLHQWLILPLALLLLSNALAFALPSSPLMPQHSQTSMTQHMQMAAMPDMGGCHSHQPDCQPQPHCAHPSACNLCHASPALVGTGYVPAVVASVIKQVWQLSFYTSIVIAHPDRPPAIARA